MHSTYIISANEVASNKTPTKAKAIAPATLHSKACITVTSKVMHYSIKLSYLRMSCRSSRTMFIAMNDSLDLMNELGGG